MEEKFKSMPLTILDILGIFIPGTIWFILLVTTFSLKFNIKIEEGISPLTSIESITTFFANLNSPLLAAIIFIGISLLIGYILRPVAMRPAEWISLPFQKFHKNTKGFKLNEIKYPYKKLFEKEGYYQIILEIIEKVTGCKSESLPGKHPFNAAKRYLKLVSPSLWEESERREAEVRMSGAILLAMIYSSVLSFAVLIFQYLKVVQFDDKSGTWLWFIFSIFLLLILSVGFRRLRYGEIANTYLNILIAYQHFDRKKRKKNND